MLKYLYCKYTLYMKEPYDSDSEKIDFIKGKYYRIVDVDLDGYCLIDENKKIHAVRGGWKKYFLDTKQLRRYKLNRLITKI